MIGDLIVQLMLVVIFGAMVIESRIIPVDAPLTPLAIDTNHDPHPQYTFAYNIQDAYTGDQKSQQETREGDVVKGSYSVVEADGTIRTIGFVALLSTVNAGVVQFAPVAAPLQSLAYTAAAPVAYAAAPFARTVYQPQFVASRTPAALVAAAPVAAAAQYVAAAPAQYVAAAPAPAVAAARVVAAAPAAVAPAPVVAARAAPVVAAAAPVLARTELDDAYPQYQYAYNVQDTLTGGLGIGFVALLSTVNAGVVQFAPVAAPLQSLAYTAAAPVAYAAAPFARTVYQPQFVASRAPAALVAAAPVAAAAQYVAAAPAQYVAAAPAPAVAAARVVAAAPAAVAPAPVVAARAAPVVAAAAPVLARTELDDAYPQYQYAYNVQDTLTGDSKTQEETREGEVVRGSYSLIEPDGARRVVKYYADPVNGFNAVVQRDVPVAAAPVVAAKTVVAPAVVAPAAPAKIIAAKAVLLNRENFNRMRMKLDPNLYHNPHTMAANLRDNTTLDDDRRLSADFGPAIIPSATPLDITDEEGFVVLEEDLRFSQEVSILEEPQAQEVDREKIIISYECELIVLMSRIKGKLEISATSVAFVDQSQQQQDQRHDFKFSLALLREIHLRKYNLRRSALEIFLWISEPPNIQYGSGRAPSELLKASGLTQKWVNREISNFDYLMHLNTIAGRTHNDLSQYPIFPWILADYTSEILDLTDPKSFRDLSKPIGVVNPKNEIEVRSKYENFEDPSGVIPKFHYGTHYSNSAGVLHYLLRIEPFTTLHVELQSGRFDVADRQFHSINQTWRQLMDSPNDVKELIPEFFYMPDFLSNINGLDLGMLQTTKEKISDVILPPWAQSPESFIAIHRRALESDYVSANLHHWIDLIFGYKQKGRAAIEALNVFYYCSYEGAVDLDKITDAKEREAIEGMINNFGQTPSQLLREAHPRRLTSDECLVRLLRNDIKRPEFINYLDRVSSVYCDLSTEKDPVVYLSVPRTPQRSFLQSGPDVLISVTRSGTLSTHTWAPYDKEKGFIFGTDSAKTRKVLTGAFHPAVKLSGKLFALNLEGKLLYTGGIWDCSLKVFSVHKGRAVASVVAHSDVITCLAIDSGGMYLVTGSRDCTCVLWSISNTNLTQSSVGLVNLAAGAAAVASPSGSSGGAASLLAPQPLKALHGHESAISAVAIMTEFDLVASGSMDGTVNLYSIESGQLIRTVSPLGCTGVTIEISFVTISYQGHVAFSALDDTSYSVHAFTVNGVHVGSKYVSGRVTSLATISDLLVVSDDAGDITISRLNGLKPIFDIPLHIPIETLVVVPGNSHLLVPLRDGNLAVVGVIMPNNPGSISSTSTGIPSTRKHSILTV
uniref:Putative lysosomal trafficking regulator lyst n=1 Tax=Lutzomyia longipalpis TaxID=7200 RepID=A0A1B0CP51_LUTLO